MPRTKLLTCVAALTIVAATASAPAYAAPARPSVVQGRAQAVTHTVTLVTGDVVTVTTLAGGEQTAEVDRPDDATGGVHVQESGGDLYVLPDEVFPLLSTNRLDRRLFNVTDLIEMGYDDAKTSAVPLIATYATKAKTKAAPVGSRVVRQLASVGGAALTADKKQVRAFWAEAEQNAGITKLWLDGRVEAALAESVPQVGAPQAWVAGYDGSGVTVAVLDTGVDATHPDLVGQIGEKVSFVPGEDTSDVNGHGTHVASTVAGTGAASGGTLKGVAPGADLIVGKVLGNDGYGADSWVLAGMQWAAESGADVVSMSLGDNVPTDGTDPMSAAVDALSTKYGTLFVVAAGNDGPETIGTPAAAASALTVGAVDKQDALAYFSSTGPVFGSGAIKPDIAAPGVDINAARSQQAAEGSGMYQALSGTSMATPHVSGAAAILAQQHPDWSGQRLKDALMSSAKGLDNSPYEVGAGRLDVAAAVTGTVTATGSVYFGAFDWPHEPGDGPVARTVRFTNDGATARTLALATQEPFAAPAQVTVPAKGSADVTVTGDPTTVDPGRHAGYLVATDAGTGTPVTRTALGLVKEDERYNLTIKLVDRVGKPARDRVVVNRAGDVWPGVYEVNGALTLRLPPGTYSLASYLDVPGERADSLGLALLVAPETVLGGTTEVTLDARKARRLDTAAPGRTQDRQRRLDFSVGYADGGEYRDAYVIPLWYDDLYVLPTKKVTRSTFELATRWRKGEPPLSVSWFDTIVQAGSSLTEGSDRRKVVYAGDGADYAGVNAKGKIVVVTRSDAVSPEERAAKAVEAGAKLLLVVHDAPGGLSEYVGEQPIPVASVHRDAGAALVALAKTGRLTLGVTQRPATAVIYDLTRNYAGAVPDRPLQYRPSHRDLARIDARYYAVRDVDGAGFRYDMTFTPSVGFREREWYPGTRTEWVTPGQVWHEQHQQGVWMDAAHRNAYAKGSTTRLDWFAPATRPAFSRTYAVQNGRYRDFMTVNVQTWSPSGETLEHGGYIDWGEVPTNMKLYQGGKLLHENEFGADLQWAEVPAGRLPYRLVLDASRPAEQWRLSTRTHTEWDFVSGSNEAEDFVPFALLQLDYRLETDLRGDVKGGTTQRIGVRAGPQPGGTGTGRVTSLTLDVSYDDGATWQKVSLHNGVGSLKLPKRGYVSVRASAATDAGWRISQEVIRAYGLR
ncbi:S8 family serine peptidase [Phytohabitans rumicis]|uniref:Peptidase n=1 Tax=Phytohabitans rumicis TaxID=1076125 RepID=A0A6V8KU63_9ACTN|nr:S8 family serine peptidase [Phytohabitans rumicis]GFJ88622.1 peptidase [Phytohabitans rumicis]